MKYENAIKLRVGETYWFENTEVYNSHKFNASVLRVDFPDLDRPLQITGQDRGTVWPDISCLELCDPPVTEVPVAYAHEDYDPTILHIWVQDHSWAGCIMVAARTKEKAIEKLKKFETFSERVEITRLDFNEDFEYVNYGDC